MSIFKIKLRTSDRLWTQYKRIQEDYTCQKCGRVYSPDNCGNLHCAHYHGRSHENVRFDEENTLCLCGIPCHQYFDTHKTEFEAFMLKRLGRECFDLLALRAHIRKDRQDKLDALIIRQMLKEG